ncbi:MAG: hypothetical protein DMG13_05775 [Acidobacteria bacterium]|nr:MAG: hypothetical protein DMG13_05775 [Acidobacteriota bacterium]
MNQIVPVGAALFLILPISLQAQSRPEFHISPAAHPPKIDGDLHDEVWDDDALVLGEWISYNPLYGTRMPQRTEVRIAYDERNLYFAFHCFDSEPGKIRTTISRRDSVFNDDWVGFSLDSNGTGQTSYHLIVNPSGIQMDALNTSSSGERWEADLVWDSAGKLTGDGYIVEIRLPLESIRFQGGNDVKMGVLFWRRISRSGISSSWPDIPPGNWVFNRHAQIVFPELKQPRLIEVLPSVTYSINQLRATSDSWNGATGKSDVGLSAKYGITSSITLDATINPDFSQVESDAFQVQVNQRFPIFFSEKRPFFMEGMGLFNLAGSGGDGNMITAVHTRKIIDPAWGSKLTGTAGKFTFGVLNASDASPQDFGGRGASIAGKTKLFNVARVTYGLGESNYAGGILLDTEHAGRHNRVAGADLSVRFKGRQQFSATFLSSETGINAAGPGKQGTAEQIFYNYSNRKYALLTQVEHYGKDFQMDTAFYNRTGFTSGWGYGELNFYPKDTNKAWLKRANVFTWNKYGRDQIQDGNERFSLIGLRMNFTRQGFFRIDQGWGREPWLGKRFNDSRIRAQGNVQIFRWLNLNGNFSNGWATYYDQVNPFEGRSRSSGAGFTLQPNQHVNQNVNYSRVRFNRASDGHPVYTVHIVNLRSTYQFNKHFLLRAIEQFDSSRHRLLTDLLASYEFVPGTVFHAGYGSLFEKRDGAEYLTTSRGLFVKASYLHRF